MPYPRRDEDHSDFEKDQTPVRVEPMEDEEKILAGLPDVNMLALMIKDVQGG